ncbi:hypothetical protein FXO37_25362 [Capsicum annuum]|nr:hypothetical protein FXO37_25362 [Capsicum annuum]
MSLKRKESKSGLTSNHITKKARVQMDSKELPEQSQSGKSKAEERYENDVEGGGQGSIDDERKMKLRKPFDDFRKTMKNETIDEFFKKSCFGHFLKLPKDHIAYFQMSMVYGLLKHRIKLGNLKPFLSSESRSRITQMRFLIQGSLGDLGTSSMGVASGVVDVGGRDADVDAAAIHDDEHVDAQGKINMFENAPFTGPSHPHTDHLPVEALRKQTWDFEGRNKDMDLPKNKTATAYRSYTLAYIEYLLTSTEITKPTTFLCNKAMTNMQKVWTYEVLNGCLELVYK